MQLENNSQPSESNTTSSVMASNDGAFPFLKLPAELRIRIYHFTFASIPSFVDLPSGTIDIPTAVRATEPTELLQINRQIRNEVNPEFIKHLDAQKVEKDRAHGNLLVDLLVNRNHVEAMEASWLAKVTATIRLALSASTSRQSCLARERNSCKKSSNF